jgi:hypothetical protein
MSNGTLGFPLQGVNQQPERVQQDGHVREQINLYPDPNAGLTSRPATVLLDTYSSVPANANINTVLLDGELYLLATYEDADTNEGVVRLFGYDGTEYTVTVEAGTEDYFKGQTIAYATDGKVYIVNREVVVATDVPTFTDNYKFGYAYSLGGQFSRTYKITLTYDDATVAIGEYTTPDGDVAGDAEKTAANYIIDELMADLQLDANFKVSTLIDIAEEVAWIRDASFDFDIIASDGANNEVLRAGVSDAKTFTDVPRFAPHGAIIRVRGDTGTLDDELWLRFTSDTTTTVGDGFGVSGAWRETTDPDALLILDNDTMPHVMTIDKALGTADVGRGEWEGRQTGTTVSNPQPSFVGKTISDIGEFQRRLWLIAGGSFIASQTDKPLDFWRSTVATQLATDPVDIKTSGEEESFLLYGVQYDTNLIVFSKAGQFLIDGSIGITSGTANIVRTTKFEMSTKARPVVAGDTVMFPYKFRIFSGVNEMQPSSEITSNSVDSLNKVTQKYIRGEIIGLASAGNSKILIARTDNDPRLVYVYNFLWNGNQKVQSAWHKWTFAEDLIHAYVEEGVVYLWFRNDTSTSLCALRPDKPLDFDLPYAVCMDMVREVTGPTVTLDRDDYTFVCVDENDDYAAGRPVTPDTVVEDGEWWEYTFPDFAPTGMIAGVVFDTEVQPNAPISKDWRGNGRHQDMIVVSEYIVDFEDSGEVEAYMKNVYRSPDDIFMVSSARFPTEDSPVDGFGTTITSGSFSVPWGDDQFTSALVLRTRTPQPVTYVEIRWRGQVFKKA